MTHEFVSLEEVRDALGAPLGPTTWYAVDQKRIDAFAEATGDHQWIHTDPSAPPLDHSAARSPTGT